MTSAKSRSAAISSASSPVRARLDGVPLRPQRTRDEARDARLVVDHQQMCHRSPFPSGVTVADAPWEFLSRETGPARAAPGPSPYPRSVVS